MFCPYTKFVRLVTSEIRVKKLVTFYQQNGEQLGAGWLWFGFQSIVSPGIFYVIFTLFCTLLTLCLFWVSWNFWFAHVNQMSHMRLRVVCLWFIVFLRLLHRFSQSLGRNCVSFIDFPKWNMLKKTCFRCKIELNSKSFNWPAIWPQARCFPSLWILWILRIGSYQALNELGQNLRPYLGNYFYLLVVTKCPPIWLANSSWFFWITCRNRVIYCSLDSLIFLLNWLRS